jgi:hypothetical protein
VAGPIVGVAYVVSPPDIIEDNNSTNAEKTAARTRYILRFGVALIFDKTLHEFGRYLT